ncbi:MAG TPA: hypothetical protein VJU84_17930 [Pyrinomonadaceae bacterium]|nr:hypothetical protein [Pyrinomonadaceae bacterium]
MKGSPEDQMMARILTAFRRPRYRFIGLPTDMYVGVRTNADFYDLIPPVSY